LLLKKSVETGVLSACCFLSQALFFFFSSFQYQMEAFPAVIKPITYYRNACGLGRHLLESWGGGFLCK
jgi:hypothetical protein